MSMQTLKGHTWRIRRPVAQASAHHRSMAMPREAECANTDTEFPGPLWNLKENVEYLKLYEMPKLEFISTRLFSVVLGMRTQR